MHSTNFAHGAKDRLTFKISHFTVQILPVDIQTKVRKIQELLENSDFLKMIYSFIAHHFAENFDARLAGIVIQSDCPLLEKKSRKASNP